MLFKTNIYKLYDNTVDKSKQYGMVWYGMVYKQDYKKWNCDRSSATAGWLQYNF